MNEHEIMILVADDEETMHIYFKTMLIQFSVICVHNGMQVMEFLTKQTPDLIILDYSMPEMDGLACAWQIKNQPEWEKIPIVIFTCKRESEFRDQPKVWDAFITKPVKRSLLSEQIRRLLAAQGKTFI